MLDHAELLDVSRGFARCGGGIWLGHGYAGAGAGRVWGERQRQHQLEQSERGKEGKGGNTYQPPLTAIAPQISAPTTDSSWDIVDQAGFPTSSQMDTLLEFAQSFEQHNYPDINLEEGYSHNMASIRAGSSRKREATTTAVFASEEPPRQRQKWTYHNADKIIAKGVIGGNFARVRVQIVTENHVRVEAVPKRILNAGSVGQKLVMDSYEGIKPIFALELDNWS
ncbi:hypothetical protein DFH08DRAFT_812637 [Mycena albidolilacea]|uniref:Uncharacterized protein n=1 Tax=Mycena albidolilacea TaxID=1033008 RepID=A0AAD7EM64_9AGAR|nr:hypothetical protein DFH08DRAFT_812637 [Mycena albidolilacea]